MKKIRVYIQYPWKVSDSQYYKSLIESPPKGISYINEKKQGMIINKNQMLFINFLKRILRNFTHKSKLAILNIRKTPTDQKFDLIHCAHCLSFNNSPWVADFESSWQMLISDHGKGEGREKVLKILKKQNCKKIITWTESAKKELLIKYPEIKNKVEIVSHAIPFPKFQKRKKKKIRLLFIGRYFRRKGGLHTLEAFDKLTKKYPNVEAFMISPVPEEIRKKYEKNTKIKFFGLIPYEKIIKKILPSSDIYVCPGYSDTFGFPFIEALAFGLPIITVDGFARKDIVDEGKTGFIIPRKKPINSNIIGPNEEEIIKKIIKKTSKLIENKKLRENMSKNCKYEVKEGKFSIKKRNQELKKIYLDALQ